MDTEKLLARTEIRRQIKSCTSCNLHASCTAPVPFSGPSDASVVVIGEAPGKQEDARGEPFVGLSGRLLRAWLAEADFDMETVAFVNVVSCYPNRTPTSREIEACRGNLVSQLAHIGARWHLVLGGVAVNALLPLQLRIGEVRGLWWRMPEDAAGEGVEAWALATWHPAAVLRNRTLEDQALGDVLYMSMVAQRPDVFVPGNNFCVKCKSPLIERDVRGILFCAAHDPSGKGRDTSANRDAHRTRSSRSKGSAGRASQLGLGLLQE